MNVGGAPIPRDYGGKTGTERAELRKATLLDVALAIVSSGGRSALSIDSVCREAGLNKRYFRESFDGLDDLFGELIESLSNEAIDTALATLPAAPGDSPDVRRAVGAFVEYLTDDPRRGRVLFGELPPGTSAARSRNQAIHQITTIVATRGSQIFDLESDERVAIAAAMMVGGTSQAVLDWIDGRIGGDQEDFVDELVSNWLAIADATIARAQRS